MKFRYMAIIAVIVVGLDDKARGKQLTFINEDESSVRLSNLLWNVEKTLHVKFIMNGDDGAILTVITRYADRLQILCESEKLQFKLNDERQHLPGMTDRNVNLNEWIDLTISQSKQGLKVRLNDKMAVLSSSQDWMVLNWEDVYLGAFSTAEKKYRSFIGCIDIFNLTASYANLVNDDSEFILERHSVITSCIDACSVHSCKNGGRCKNRYSNAMCDCRGTGYQGSTCEQASPAVYFDGGTFLAYDTSQNPNLDFRHDVRVRFRTKESQGVILATSFEEDFLTVEMHRNLIFVTARFRKETIHLKSDQALSDDNWHFLMLSHRNSYLLLTIDDDVSAKAFLVHRDTRSSTQSYSMQMTGGEELVYFGGAKDMGSLKFSHSRSNFKGCMQELSFNGHDVLEKVLYTGDWKFTRHGKLRECRDRNS